MRAGGDRVADVKVFDLGHSHDIPRDRFRHIGVLLALHQQQAARPRRLPGSHIQQRLFRGELAGIDAKIAEVADEAVGKRLEYLADKFGRFLRLHSHLAGALALSLGGGARPALYRR